jgi:hypothetical protein
MFDPNYAVQGIVTFAFPCLFILVTVVFSVGIPWQLYASQNSVTKQILVYSDSFVVNANKVLTNALKQQFPDFSTFWTHYNLDCPLAKNRLLGILLDILGGLPFDRIVRVLCHDILLVYFPNCWNHGDYINGSRTNNSQISTKQRPAWQQLWSTILVKRKAMKTRAYTSWTRDRNYWRSTILCL